MSRPPVAEHVVLFLCTGNYYRSRFAEELFNHLARRRSIRARAESRGLAIERGVHNVGAISPHALAGLRSRQVVPTAAHRTPSPVTAGDFERADRVIALHEPEHRPFMADRHPKWADRIDYWSIPDVGELHHDEALASIAEQVEALIGALDDRAAFDPP